MATRPATAQSPAAVLPGIRPALPEVPPLENGDRLTRPEFERRYDSMPHVKKAELIEGVVHMPSPVRIRHHGTPHALVMTWLGTYWGATPGVQLADNTTVRFDLDNELQPDALLRLERGGTSRVDDDDYLEGPPELVVEVASSSVSIDLHRKLQVYRRSGVQEYLVWAVRDGMLLWYELREGRYEPMASGDDGVLRSRVFPGLWLAWQPLLEGRLPAVLEGLQQGLASAGHAAFRERLAAQAQPADASPAEPDAQQQPDAPGGEPGA